MDLGGHVMAPASSDINRDGSPDVAAAVGSKLHILDATGQPVTGWPADLPSAAPSNITAPSIGDLDFDGAMEIVMPTTEHVTVYEPNGSVCHGWPQPISMSAQSVALGDVDADGTLEVVVSTGWHWSTPSPDGYMYIWNADGTILPGWPKHLSVSLCSRAVLGDVDGDSVVDIVLGAGDGKVYAWHADGNDIPGWPKTAGGSIQNSSPVITDLDKDGTSDVLVGSTNGNVYVIPCDTPYDRTDIPWPMHGHDATQCSALPNKADFNFDWRVDFADLAVFVAHWLNDCNTPDWCDGCDFDKSTVVDLADFAEFSANWLPRKLGTVGLLKDPAIR